MPKTSGHKMTSPLSMKICVAAILLLIFVPMILSQNSSPRMTSETEIIDVTTLRSGDLVFRQGRGIFSDFFKNIGNADSPFSHVGIIHVDGNDAFVIHTEANELTGVGFAKKEPLANFISAENALTYDFYRVDDLSSVGEKTVLKAALKYVNDQIPFDTEFNLEDNDRLYCTELVYKAYKTAGISLVGKPDIIQVPGVNGMRKLEAIPIGQLLKSSSLKLNSTITGD